MVEIKVDNNKNKIDLKRTSRNSICPKTESKTYRMMLIFNERLETYDLKSGGGSNSEVLRIWGKKCF